MLSRINAAALFVCLALAAQRVPLDGSASLDAPSQDTARGHTDADVAFMKGMLGHHAQALVMTSLVPSRSTRRDLRILAERIDASQRGETTMMQRWLQHRGHDVPEAGGTHDHHAMPGEHGLMPGMLDEAEMARLMAATGAAFDRLFLAYMIRHHEGALTMVKQLLANKGAAQEPEIFRFISDVDADQSAEIRRMRTMQRTAQQKIR